MDTAITITESYRNGVKVITVEGHLDATNAPQLEDTFEKTNQKEDSKKILLDFEGLVYISSAGLRVLLTASKQFSEREISFSICSLCPDVKQIFDISGFTSIFSIYESNDEALQNLS